MRYARIVDHVAVEVVTAPPTTLFTPEIAAQFVVVPDIEPGSVHLPVIVNDTPTDEREWHPPRSFVEEFEPGKFRHAQHPAVERSTFQLESRRPLITRLAFINRFTDAEWVAFDMVAIDNPSGQPAERQQRSAMRLFIKKVELAQYIDLNRPDTRAGVQALEAGGLLGAGRAAEILDTPVQAHEAWSN
jgi:hypothetical protein